MTTKIEQLDRKRTAYRRGYVIWLIVFVIAWVTRSILKLFEIEIDILETVLLIILVLSVAIQAYYAVKENLLKREIKNDPFLEGALNNELVRLNELKAWRAAFFTVIVYTILVAILSLFITINDLMMIFITALLIGFGAYNLAAYILNR